MKDGYVKMENGADKVPRLPCLRVLFQGAAGGDEAQDRLPEMRQKAACD